MLYFSRANMEYVFEHFGIFAHFHQCYYTQWNYAQVTVALAFNNNQIIYYHTDVQWSVGLAQTFFANPNYLVVKCWVHATFMSPYTIHQTESMSVIILSSLMMWWATHLWASFVLNPWM